MKLVTSKQMRRIDEEATSKFKIPSLTLMEKAGKSLTDFLAAKFKPARGMISVLVGRGNNGGDGLVAARRLIELGYEVQIFLTSSPQDLSPDAYANWQSLVSLTPRFYEILDVADIKTLYPELLRSTCIIDALFGTGLSKEIGSPYKEIIELSNNLEVPVLACDIPSGLSADNGYPQGVAIKARWTITFGLPKLGLFIGDGPSYAGEVKVADIGFPKEMIEKIKTDASIIDPEIFKDNFAPRRPESHKGDFGHILIVAGSHEKLGAGYLSCMAALRSGTGLVTYAMPGGAFLKFDARFPEIMPIAIKDKGHGYFTRESLEELLKAAEGKDVLLIGPAIGTNNVTKGFLIELIKRINLPMVIDADALTILADDLAILNRRTSPTVLTPHPGEMARLLKSDEVKEGRNRIPLSVKFSTAHKVHLVLKGHLTVVATPDGSSYINTTGNPAMASAGMGDSLAGIIAGFLAQRLPATTAVVAAVYTHGLAGDIAAGRFGDRGIVASDLIKCIPEAIRSFSNED